MVACFSPSPFIGVAVRERIAEGDLISELLPIQLLQEAGVIPLMILPFYVAR